MAFTSEALDDLLSGLAPIWVANKVYRRNPSVVDRTATRRPHGTVVAALLMSVERAA
jgi:hypothetical protein